MSDNLRTRIADIIERVGNDWDAQMMSSIVDGKPQPQQPLADTAAQAIIDEFWLEVVSGGGRPGQRQQIVGRWEKQ